MYGVALDPSGNYILLGGSGDEGPAWYNELNSAGWKSKVWVSYLVVVDTKVNITHVIVTLILLLLKMSKSKSL